MILWMSASGMAKVMVNDVVEEMDCMCMNDSYDWMRYSCYSCVYTMLYSYESTYRQPRLVDYA